MIMCADARAVPLAAGSVQCVVTSPPYWGLRDYGVPGQLGLESSPDEYVAHMVAVFREIKRVLRDDGTVWLNLGDSYVGGGGFYPDAPSNQPDAMAARNMAGREKWQTEARRKGGARVSNLKFKDLVGIPWRVAFALQADGWWLRSDIIWAKPNPMPESVTDRPTRSHEYLFLLTKAARYYYDNEAVREPLSNKTTGGNCPDGGPKVNAEHRFGSPRLGRDNRNPNGRNARSVWTITTQAYKGCHFAVMPEKLVEPCILAGSKPGDLVLDPFCGSGTVGVVCARYARRFVSLDLKPEYCRMARQRLRETQPGLELTA